MHNMEGNMQILKKSITDVNYIVSICYLGLLLAVESKATSIDNAGAKLLNPYTIKILKEYGVDERILELIEEGLEIESILSLVPEEFQEEIDNLKVAVLDVLSSLPQEKNKIVNYLSLDNVVVQEDKLVAEKTADSSVKIIELHKKYPGVFGDKQGSNILDYAQRISNNRQILAVGG